MFFISNLCILCLNYKNLKSVLIEDNEGLVIQMKLIYCLPEIVDSHLDIPEYICINCLSKLDCFYKFKQWCLQNNTHLKSYFKTLTSNGETHKLISVGLTDIKYQNKLLAESEDQTLPNIGSGDELGNEGKEDNRICIKEEETVFNNEINHADVLDNGTLCDEEKDTIVKKEGLISDDNQNKLQAESEDQALPTVGSDDELRTGRKEDKETCSEEAEADIKNIIHCVDVLDNKESHPLSDITKDIIVKEECFTSEDNGNFEIYNKFLKTIKNETISSDSDISVSNNEDAYANSKYSSSNSENISNEPKDKTKTFQCTICSKKFLHKYSLVYHLKIHAGIKDYSCSICDKKFRQKGDLIAHERTHTGIKNYECTICKKKFRQKSTLNVHMQTHSEERKYECKVCKKQYKFKSGLKQHELRHTGVKNFQCAECKKKFSSKTDLNTHMKIHTGVKNFECSTCNKKFMRKAHLEKHEKIHARVKTSNV